MDPSPRAHRKLSLLGGFQLSFGDDPLTLSRPPQRLVADLAVLDRYRDRALRR